jgi:recombinase
MTFPDLARWLGEKGVSYTGQAIRKLIKNRVYLGQARGAFGFVNDDAHVPIVSRLLFDQANSVNDTSLRRPRTGATTGRLLCQGFVICESCGWTLQPSTKKLRKDGTLPLAYQCENVHCGAKARIMWDMLDPYVDEWFRDNYARLATIKVLAAYGDPGRYNRALAAYEAAEYDRDQFLANTKSLTLLGPEKWNATLERYVNALEEASLDLEAAKNEMPDPDERIPLEELWDSWSVLERRDYLMRFVKRIVVRPVYGKYGVPVERRVRIETYGWRKLNALEYKLPRVA